MRILIVGEGRYDVYERSLCDQLIHFGHQCEVIGWASRFMLDDVFSPGHQRFRSLRHQLEERLAVGHEHRLFNQDVLETAATFRPQLVLLYNAKQVTRRTVATMRKLWPRLVIAQYNNDNPYSRHASWTRWRHVRRSAPLVDVGLAYRHRNLEDLKRRGVPNTFLWRSACTLEDLREGSRKNVELAGIVFAGHYEDDSRVMYLESVLQAGLDLRVHGGGWQEWKRSPQSRGKLLSRQRLLPLTGSEYRRSVAQAKVALTFLSTLNEDSYTRRSFEIPALGTAQLSQYSKDLARLFEEDEEIVFFRDATELVSKARLLLEDDEFRRRIAIGGRNRVMNDGHDIRSRTAELLEIIRDLVGEETQLCE